MDQLKAILEYKFWILAGLAILLPPIGWWTRPIASPPRLKRAEDSMMQKRQWENTGRPDEKWIQGARKSATN